jgi:hypothetical protein
MNMHRRKERREVMALETTTKTSRLYDQVGKL